MSIALKSFLKNALKWKGCKWVVYDCWPLFLYEEIDDDYLNVT
jgi:hypothetical protein